VVAAQDKDIVGALNVVDDEPSPVRTWLPELARILAAGIRRRTGHRSGDRRMNPDKLTHLGPGTA
jgi:hypothetical protein